MARLEQLNRTKYPMQASPLYGLRSKKKLAEVLGWASGYRELDKFARQLGNYNCFAIEREGKEPRPVQHPNKPLELLHKRIAKLLLRIAPPDYLHSGLRGRSFVTNASRHVNLDPAIKLDIHKFYPSTLHSHVCGFFKNQMECAPDVAGMIASISCVTMNGVSHLPTGSPLSQILAFYSHKRMFDELDAYVTAHGGVFTVYVDDITASMKRASPGEILGMGRIVTKHGLKWHKERFFPRGCPKAITGAIAKGEHLEAPNRQHQKYARARDRIGDSAVAVADQKRAAQRAIGILQCIAQVDERRSSTAAAMTEKLTNVAGI